MVTSTPGEACGINRATTLSGKLWKKPWATSSSPQRQLRYQHALDDDKGTRTAPLTWLLSHQECTWLSAETLTPYGSDHLLVVFSLQRAAKKQNSKPHNPFRYERSGSDTVSKLRKRKPTQSANGSRKSKMQPPWWDSETEKAWTEKRAAVKSWQKGRT